MFNYKSYGDLARDVASNIQKIPSVDLVVGIPKSGIIPGIMVASFKNVRFMDLDSFIFSHSSRSGKRKYSAGETSRMSVLVIDDSVNTGAEFTRTRERLAPLTAEFDFIFTAIYGVSKTSPNKAADLVLSHVPQPRVFQWNYRNHIIAEHALFDMDGVLCADPADEDNDDGEAYLRFLANALPLTIPAKTISGIVTSRLEKYRAQTEDWLHRHDVRYKDLLMLDLPSAAERRRLKAHAPFKAEIYKGRDEILFVESNWKQARTIAEQADKPVICTENDVLLFGADHLKELAGAGRLLRPEEVSLEYELQRKLSELAAHLVAVDPHAATWLKQAGIKVSKGLTPLGTSRIVTSAMARRELALKPMPAKSTDRRRILMISCTFDVKRGAGAAASSLRLRDALAEAGAEVLTLSLEDFPHRQPGEGDRPLSGTKMGFWGNYADRTHWRELSSRIDAIDPDCIILGAVDRGILSMFDIARLRYPIVWVARDNWLHTGGCLFKLKPSETAKEPACYEHFMPALVCEGYKADCSSCPALGDVRESGKAQANLEVKRIVFEYRKDIVLAPLSDWLAEILREAPVTRNNPILACPNPINRSQVRAQAQRPSRIRQQLGLSESTKLVLLAAHSVQNPRKGLRLFLEAVAASDDPRLKDVVFVQMGKDDPRKADVMPGLRIHSLGFVESEADKVDVYNEVDATVVPSLQESLSVVASDSICCGTPVVSFRASGMASYLEHGRSGYLAVPFDGQDMVRGVLQVLFEWDPVVLRRGCLDLAERTFDAERNAAFMLGLVERAIDNFAGLAEVPVELQALASLAELMNEDLQFRYSYARDLKTKLDHSSRAPAKAENPKQKPTAKLHKKSDRNRAQLNKLENAPRFRRVLGRHLTVPVDKLLRLRLQFTRAWKQN